MKLFISIFATMLSLASAAAAGNPAMTDSESADTLRTEMRSADKYVMPLNLTARDFITKVYGFVEDETTREGTVKASGRLCGLVPQEDEFGLWLNPECGYAVSYYGMTPDVEAMARFEKERLSNYGFFFLFPYKEGMREDANRRQSEFTGCLLQELHDLGLVVSLNEATDAIFDAVSDYEGNFVDLRLIEEVVSPDGSEYPDKMSAKCEASAMTPESKGRFILILNVEPGGFTVSDNLAAN